MSNQGNMLDFRLPIPVPVPDDNLSILSSSRLEESFKENNNVNEFHSSSDTARMKSASNLSEISTRNISSAAVSNLRSPTSTSTSAAVTVTGQRNSNIIQTAENLELESDFFSLGKEPQVMRTKKMGHRKPSSLSFGLNSYPDLINQNNFSPVSASASPITPHGRNSSNNLSDLNLSANNLSAINNLSANSILSGPETVRDSSNSNTGTLDDFFLNPSISMNDAQFLGLQHQPLQRVANGGQGHRRFNSTGQNYVGNPQTSPMFMNNSFQQSHQKNISNHSFQPSHQKNLSGTSSMFEGFNVLNIQKDAEMMQTNMQNMRPMRSLHQGFTDYSPAPEFSHLQCSPQQPAEFGYSAQQMFGNGQNIEHQQHMHNDLNVEQASASLASIYQQQKDAINMQNQSKQNSLTTFEGDVPFENDEYSQIITTCGWASCNLELHTQENLVTHILQDHVGNGKASYVCEWNGCSRMCKPFSKRHKVQNHVRIHTGERPFACPMDDCGKRFSRQDGLNTHIKTHSSVKPFICSFAPCSKAYFHARSLRKHERMHIESGIPPAAGHMDGQNENTSLWSDARGFDIIRH